MKVCLQIRFCFVLIFLAPSLTFADADYSKLSGEALIQLLQKPESRIAAYHELSLRNDPKTEKEIKDFENKHRNPEVIVCPQSLGKLPVYAVLSDSLRYIREDTALSKPQVIAKSLLAKKDDLLIEVFTSDGRKIDPFEFNDNLLDGIMMDMNRDGFIERASLIPFGVKEVEHTFVLKVERVGELEERLLAVLYNWGEQDDWDYAFSDRENDGYIEIEFGPITEDGVEPQVTFRWDDSKNQFVPATTVFQNHLIILDPKAIWTDLERLKKEANFFSPDSRAMNEDDRFYYRAGKLPSWKEEQQKAVSTSYVAQSLKELSNQQIYEYMGSGKTLRDLEHEESPRTTIPEQFWKLPPREAAQLILESNRSAEHKSKYKIVIGPANHGAPPDNYSLAVSYSGAHSMAFPKWFLRIDPKVSYLLTSSVTNRHHYMLQTMDLDYQAPAYDFRMCPLKYEDAKHVLQTIWWLREAKTEPAGKLNDEHNFHGTGGGSGTVQFISAGDQSFVTADAGGHVSECWNTSFEGEELVGIILEIFWDTLAKRTDPCMNGFMDWLSQEVTGKPDDKKVHESAGHFLKLFSHDQEKISHAMAIEAIHSAGDFTMADLEGTLEQIKKTLPRSAGTSRCTDVDTEIDKLREESDKASEKIDPENIDAYLESDQIRSNRLMTLYDEWSSIRHGAIKECALQEMQDAINRSLQQIRSAKDASALRTWIAEKKSGWDWALWRLKEVDKATYGELLKSWFPKATDEEKIALLKLLFEVDQTSAVEFARRSRGSEEKKLATTAFSILADAGTSEEKAQSVSTLIHFALDPLTDTSVRRRILSVLVPEKHPGNHQHPEIDSALLEMLDLPPGEYGSSNLTDVVECLLRRTGTKHLNEIMAHFDKENIDYGAMSIFEKTFPEMSEEQQRDFTEKLRPIFYEGHNFLDEIAVTAWALDLKVLREEIERIATGKPDDVEMENCMGWSSVATKVTGRCHKARQISALWNEDDPLTKAKGLISFFLQNPDNFVELGVNRIDKLKSELGFINELTQNEKHQLKEFLLWCDAEHPFTEYDLRYVSQRTALFNFVRTKCEYNL